MDERRVVTVVDPDTGQSIELTYEQMDLYGDLLGWKRGALPDRWALDFARES